MHKGEQCLNESCKTIGTDIGLSCCPIVKTIIITIIAD